MAETTPNESKGLLESLVVLATGLLSAAQTRLELLSTELEEDRAYLFSLVAWYITAMFCFAVGLVLVVVFVVVIFWETHRLVALGSLAGLFLAMSLVAWCAAKHKAKTKPKLFSASLFELLKDVKELDSH